MGFLKSQLYVFVFLSILGAFFFFLQQGNADWSTDSDAPLATHSAIPPSGISGSSSPYLITTGTAINLHCDDTASGASGCMGIYYRIEYYDSGFTTRNSAEDYRMVCNDLTQHPSTSVSSPNFDSCSGLATLFPQTQDLAIPLNYVDSAHKYIKIKYNMADGVGNQFSDPPSAYFKAPGCVDSAPTPIPGNSNCEKFILTPPLHAVTGTVFVDGDKDGFIDGGEAGYSGSTSTINLYDGSVACGSASPTVITSNGSGAFTTGQNLVEGQNYTLCYESLPTGYEYTLPAPARYLFTMGTADEVKNFGITNSFAWWQCFGNDCRDDNGVVNKLPAGKYMAMASPLSTTPGIIYSGGTNAPSLGSGGASAAPWGWIVGGSIFIDTFRPVNGYLRTSVSYMQTTARESGIAPTTLASYCGAGGLADCTLTGITNGIYTATGNVQLNAHDFNDSPGKNYIFLINGDLTIKGNITVNTLSTVTFSATGDIHVASTVGGVSTLACDPTLAGHPGCHIEGFYSTDKNLVLDSVSPTVCSDTTKDLRVNFAGSVIVNASKTPGYNLNNHRDICGDTGQYPTYTFTERPDFYLHAPDFLKHKNAIYQEVAP